jgi:hypothetical protein
VDLQQRKILKFRFLDSYREEPKQGFWDLFPSKPLPLIESTGVNFVNLDMLLKKSVKNLTESQIKRGERAIDNLKNGASAFQKNPPLPSVVVPNAKTTFVYGETITDNIATWLKNDFAAGPFSRPPTEKIRVNSLLAVKQNEKVRPVLNISLPE